MGNVIRRFEERAAVVVGGASGLGEGIAHRLASEGASVAVLDLDAAKGEAVAAAMHSDHGVDALYASVDVTGAFYLADGGYTAR